MDGRRAPSPVTPGASDDEGWNHDCFSQIASPLTPAVLAPSGRAAPGWGRIEPLGEGVPAVEVERGASFTLGRQRSNTVRTRDRRASGQHFTIRWEQDEDLAPGFRRVGGHPPGFQLQDHSHNGTWLRRGAQRWLLRGTRIALQSGDVISLVRSYAFPRTAPPVTGARVAPSVRAPSPPARAISQSPKNIFLLVKNILIQFLQIHLILNR